MQYPSVAASLQLVTLNMIPALTSSAWNSFSLLSTHVPVAVGITTDVEVGAAVIVAGTVSA